MEFPFYGKLFKPPWHHYKANSRTPDPEIFLQEFRKIRTGIYDTPDGQKE